MTKLEEMKRYDAFVATLAEDSYLRPWLTSIRDGIERDLRCDVIPYFSIEEARAECKGLLADMHVGIARREESATRHAKAIVDSAKALAETTRKEAWRHADATRTILANDIAKLRSALNNIA